jgi:hypothetical protein
MRHEESDDVVVYLGLRLPSRISLDFGIEEQNSGG